MDRIRSCKNCIHMEKKQAHGRLSMFCKSKANAWNWIGFTTDKTFCYKCIHYREARR